MRLSSFPFHLYVLCPLCHSHLVRIPIPVVYLVPIVVVPFVGPPYAPSYSPAPFGTRSNATRPPNPYPYCPFGLPSYPLSLNPFIIPFYTLCQSYFDSFPNYGISFVVAFHGQSCMMSFGFDFWYSVPQNTGFWFLFFLLFLGLPLRRRKLEYDSN